MNPYDAQWEEHCEYEANAQYDYIREAYAATALDPYQEGYQEGYSDYVADCVDEGVEPLTFANWSNVQTPPARSAARDDLDEIPF